MQLKVLTAFKHIKISSVETLFITSQETPDLIWNCFIEDSS